MSASGRTQLVDFGIARHEDGEAPRRAVRRGQGPLITWPDFALMHEGNFRGDEQSDIFSFGVLLIIH